MNAPEHLPRATYRLQFHAGFTLQDALDLMPYWQELGISDLYASPIFRANPGSQHGYDVTDHNQINPEVGGWETLTQLSEKLQAAQMGLLLDFVPNHMGIAGSSNWRWMDVLEHGQNSRFAPYFDIDWSPRAPALQDRVLVPVLGDFYGRVLESGALQLKYEDDALWIFHYDLRFPLRPESYATILERLAWFKNPGSAISQRLERMVRSFREQSTALSSESLEEVSERHRLRDRLRRELAELIESEKLRQDLDLVLASLNGTVGDTVSFLNLHAILEDQHYRLAYWKSGAYEINYRRFFAVDSLIGLRIENLEVFDELHALLRTLIEKKIATGVRVDHIDGLWDPAQYLERLDRLGQSANGGAPVYLLVEKILTTNEELRTEWRVHGTSGYEFAGQLIDLLIEQKAQDRWTQVYRDFTGQTGDPLDLTYQNKLMILEELFANAVDSLAADLDALAKTDRYWRDLTEHELRRALCEILANLPVYRTYRRTRHVVEEADKAVVEEAFSRARERNRSFDPTPYEFIRDVWIGKYPGPDASLQRRQVGAVWVNKLQQITGAIMAKSVEDTLFYRYLRLFATNEVGHHPAEFGRDIDTFHQRNETRLRDWPFNLLATSTHDTKMSEDVRARLLALSEFPERWAPLLQQWHELNQAHKTEVDNRAAPDKNEEYLFYQVLLGVWPLGEREASPELKQRLKDYLRKAVSEAKINTTWVYPNEAWLAAGDAFVDAVLDADKSAPFFQGFLPFAEEIAQRGMVNSLTQVTLKLTSPGVPDIYQGNELWDFSLVDPDNRRPVDYALRRERLAQLNDVTPELLLEHWQDGRIKLFVTRELLRLRQKQPQLFSAGTYRAIPVSGPLQEQVVAFTRQHQDAEIIVVVPRLFGHLGRVPLGSVWGDTALEIESKIAKPWINLFTGEKGIEAVEGRLYLRQVFSRFPVAVFARGV